MKNLIPIVLAVTVTGLSSGVYAQSTPATAPLLAKIANLEQELARVQRDYGVLLTSCQAATAREEPAAVTPPTVNGLTPAQYADANQMLFDLQQSRHALLAQYAAAEATYGASCRTVHEQVNQVCYQLRRAIDVEGAAARSSNIAAIIAAARVLGIDPKQALQ